MSKLSFRARALDASKPMPIFRSEEIPDLPDFAAINRAVPQMPTGMEKEEECEHHLQRAISAQQAFGHTGELVIPTPEVFTTDEELYQSLYPADYKVSRQLRHMQPFAVDHDIPDYDMDSEDERWLTQQAKKMEVTPLQFEEMMDRLEKSSGQQVVTLKEAKLLLKEDDDLIIAVYDYWLNKRLRMQHPLIPQVKTEKRDGSTTNNPYVAFRRRTEKMQTRKNRKNDEASYEKMLKLRRDLSRAVTLLEMVKRREKTKREHLHLSIEIYEKRYQVGDYTGQILAEVSALKHTRQPYIPFNNQTASKHDVRVTKHKVKRHTDEGIPRRKREYIKKKYKQETSLSLRRQLSSAQKNDAETSFSDVLSSDDEGFSPATSPSDVEDDNDPDGPFAFRRKKFCNYHAPLKERLGNWPWCHPQEEGKGDHQYRYCLTSLLFPKRKCIGFARRRLGRGGRLLLDRAWTPLDDYWSNLDVEFNSSLSNGIPSNTFLSEVINEWPFFRPQTPPLLNLKEDTVLLDGDSSTQVYSSIKKLPSETDFESFQNHQEELFEMQRKQLERLKQEELSTEISQCVDHSFSSQPTSRFTLDSASVQFAVSALLSVSEVSGIVNSVVSSVNSGGAHLGPDGCILPSCNGITREGYDDVMNGTTCAVINGSYDEGSSHNPSTDSVIELTFPALTSSDSQCFQVLPSSDIGDEDPSSFYNPSIVSESQHSFSSNIDHQVS
ncbi:enhancer of polycomb homolog 1-like [Tachypleus tridentatus]|uniref:enhancer of polycomb homolog 1-like n=1 Tax=Tachypleus tridentatus TaxID=6853 RepID=UPI003FD64CAC